MASKITLHFVNNFTFILLFSNYRPELHLILLRRAIFEFTVNHVILELVVSLVIKYDSFGDGPLDSES